LYELSTRTGRAPKNGPRNSALLGSERKEESLLTSALGGTNPKDRLVSENALKKSGPRVGLRNLGNTCYLNAALQCLQSDPALCQQVLSLKPGAKRGAVKPEDKRAGEVKQALREIFAMMVDGGLSWVDPASFVHALGIDSARQQDAEEFLTLLVDFLGAPVRRLLEGKLQIEKRCQRCNTKRHRLESFVALGLKLFTGKPPKPVAKTGESEAASSPPPPKRQRGEDDGLVKKLHDALDRFSREIPLTGENAVFCEKCGEKTPTVDRTCLHALPELLILVTPRVAYPESALQPQKLRHQLQVPLVFNFSGWLSEKAKEVNSTDYELVARVDHLGTSPDSGHYTATVRRQGRWICLNDQYATVRGGADPSSNGSNGTEGAAKTPTQRLTDCTILMYSRQGRGVVNAEVPDDLQAYVEAQVQRVKDAAVRYATKRAALTPLVSHISQAWEATRRSPGDFLHRADEWCLVPKSWARAVVAGKLIDGAVQVDAVQQSPEKSSTDAVQQSAALSPTEVELPESPGMSPARAEEEPVPKAKAEEEPVPKAEDTQVLMDALTAEDLQMSTDRRAAQVASDAQVAQQLAENINGKGEGAPIVVDRDLLAAANWQGLICCHGHGRVRPEAKERLVCLPRTSVEYMLRSLNDDVAKAGECIVSSRVCRQCLDAHTNKGLAEEDADARYRLLLDQLRAEKASEEATREQTIVSKAWLSAFKKAKGRGVEKCPFDGIVCKAHGDETSRCLTTAAATRMNGVVTVSTSWLQTALNQDDSQAWPCPTWEHCTECAASAKEANASKARRQSLKKTLSALSRPLALSADSPHASADAMFQKAQPSRGKRKQTVEVEMVGEWWLVPSSWVDRLRRWWHAKDAQEQSPEQLLEEELSSMYAAGEETTLSFNPEHWNPDFPRPGRVRRPARFSVLDRQALEKLQECQLIEAVPPKVELKREEGEFKFSFDPPVNQKEAEDSEAAFRVSLSSWEETNLTLCGEVQERRSATRRKRVEVDVVVRVSREDTVENLLLQLHAEVDDFVRDTCRLYLDEVDQPGGCIDLTDAPSFGRTFRELNVPDGACIRATIDETRPPMDPPKLPPAPTTRPRDTRAFEGSAFAFRTAASDESPWSCRQCTFMNSGLLSRCEQCDHPRV